MFFCSRLLPIFFCIRPFLFFICLLFFHRTLIFLESTIFHRCVKMSSSIVQGAHHNQLGYSAFVCCRLLFACKGTKKGKGIHSLVTEIELHPPPVPLAPPSTFISCQGKENTGRLFYVGFCPAYPCLTLSSFQFGCWDSSLFLRCHSLVFLPPKATHLICSLHRDTSGQVPCREGLKEEKWSEI